MVEEVYLQIILFLTSTFDILLSCKINLQKIELELMSV